MSTEDMEIIYRPYITTKSGQRIYAWQKGLKAFPIRVRKGKPPKRTG